MKKTLRNIVLAGSVALAGGLGVVTYSGNGCIRNIDYENSNTTSAPDSLVYSQNSLEGKTENEKDFVPSLEEFKIVLGDRYMPEREKELKEFWENLSNGEKKLFYEGNKDKDKFKRLIEENEEYKREYETFNPENKFDSKLIERYKSFLLTKNKELENQDRAIFFTLYKLLNMNVRLF